VLPSYSGEVLNAGPDRADLGAAAQRAPTHCRAALR
jgi:hypothetical protein